MRFFGKHSHGKRGVGSIIGAVFIVLIILSGFTFYSLYSGIIDHYNKTLESMGSSDWNRNKEKLVIKGVKITGTNQLNLTVENQGTVQSHLTWFGIFNKTAVPESQAYYSLDVSVDPAEIESIVSNFTVAKGKKYVIQLVSELGNTIEYKFYPASEVRCALTLVSVSPTAYQGNNITMFLTVTHNDTEVDAIQNITVSLLVSPPSMVSLKEQPSSLTVESLRRGESAFFRWVYNTVNTGTVTFNATYDQAPAGVGALSTVEILTAPSAGGQSNVTAYGVNCTATYSPVGWTLGSTTHVSGSVSDLNNNDTNYVVFGSYHSASGSNTTLLNDGFEGAKWDDNWDDIAHTWRRSTSTVHSGSASAYASSGYAGYFTCNSLNASNADFIYVDFWFRKSGIHATDFTLYYYNGTNYNLISELDSLGADGTWLHYTEKVTSSQYFVPNFNIRFDATMGGGHYAYVDDVLIKKESGNEYTAEVEFTGTSNLQTWTRLLWQTQSCWDIGQVNVTIQVYNFTGVGAYASSGNGYLNYVSSATPNTNELVSQTITSSPNDFENSTGHWRVKIKGVKSTSTQFLMKVDWIDYTTTYSTSGNTIPYNAWQWYTIRATTASGDPIPYAYVSIYANGTSVAFRNVTDKASIVNPAWVRLNANGEFQLEIRSTSGSAETFVLYAVVGSVVGQKTIVQEAS